MSHRDFILDWEKALGFRGDPFADKIIEPASRLLVNRIEEKEKLNWFFIKGFFFGSIIGEHGVGKTMLLKWLEDRLNKYNKVHCVYINAAIFREQINIPQQIVEPLLTIYEKHITKPHQKTTNFDQIGFLKKKLGQKSIVLLIDNAHNITDRNIDIIRTLREEGLKTQIVVATTQNEYEKSRLLELGNDELNINLRRLTFDESKEMIRKRIESMGGSGLGPFKTDLLLTLYDKADKNPRQFIHLCRDEAIKLLIQKKGSIEKEPINEQMREQVKESVKEPIKEQLVIKEAPKQQSYQENKINLAKQQAPRKPILDDLLESKPETVKKQTSQEMRTGKKMFNVSFKFKKSEDLKPKTRIEKEEPEKIDFFSEEENSAVTNDRYKQDLINKLSSSSVRKKPNRLSETDKLLRDLHEEFGDE